MKPIKFQVVKRILGTITWTWVHIFQLSSCWPCSAFGFKCIPPTYKDLIIFFMYVYTSSWARRARRVRWFWNGPGVKWMLLMQRWKPKHTGKTYNAISSDSSLLRVSFGSGFKILETSTRWRGPGWGVWHSQASPCSIIHDGQKTSKETMSCSALAQSQMVLFHSVMPSLANGHLRLCLRRKKWDWRNSPHTGRTWRKVSNAEKSEGHKPLQFNHRGIFIREKVRHLKCYSTLHIK